MRKTMTAVALVTAHALLAPVWAAPVPARTPATAAPATQGDRPTTTAAGATFTAPGGWATRTAPRLLELTAPEGDLRIALVDVPAAADAKTAVAAAWAGWAPTMTRPVKVMIARPPRNGWNDRQVVDYEVSPNEKRMLYATAQRAAGTWTVVLVDGSEATGEKRYAAMSLIAQSLRPAGYTRESFAGRTAHPMDATRIAALKAFVTESMQRLAIPGAAFALTDAGRTVYATGIGVRELGKPLPVDADTEFMIASNTKGMATLLLAKLVDEGRLGWDQPVVQVYPGFRLGTPAVTQATLIRHLVCACTGLPRKDLEWIFNTAANTPASDTFRQLAATQPTSKFGEVYQYNNLMASAAGYVGGHIVHPGLELGRAFDAAMQEKVFTPLGMTATRFDTDAVMKGNWALPYGDGIDGKVVPLMGAGMALNRAVAPYRPAGGAWSTANDLIRYVRFELNEGRLDDGRQWVSARNLLQRRVANVPVGEDVVYGMGLETNTYWGVPIVHHGGSMAGYKSDIVIIPDAGIGAVILTNAESGGALLRPFMRRLVEILYDGKPEAAGDVAASAARIKAETAAERAMLTLPADPAVVAALAPAYVSPQLARLDVIRGATPALRMAASGAAMPFATKRNDDGTVSLVLIDPTFLGLPLVLADADGRQALVARDGQHEYRFAAVR